MKANDLKKQLIASIAMVLVAATALGSSTYAWFAGNNKVEATGMQVQATSEGGIEIAYAESTGTSGIYKTSATTSATSAMSLAPTSTLNTKAWYHASAESSSASIAKTNTYETLQIYEQTIEGQSFGKLGGVGGSQSNNNTTNYYMVQNFNIRSTSASAPAKGLTVDSVSVAGNTGDMCKALRVAVVLGEKVLIYDPVGNDTNPYDVFSGYTGSGTNADPYSATRAGTVTCKDNTQAQLLATETDTEIPAKGSSNNGGVDVKIFIWFEGEDTALYSDNFTTEGLTITVNFSATVS